MGDQASYQHLALRLALPQPCRGNHPQRRQTRPDEPGWVTVWGDACCPQIGHCNLYWFHARQARSLCASDDALKAVGSRLRYGPNAPQRLASIETEAFGERPSSSECFELGEIE